MATIVIASQLGETFVELARKLLPADWQVAVAPFGTPEFEAALQYAACYVGGPNTRPDPPPPHEGPVVETQKPLSWPASHVECRASEAQLSAMIAKVEQHFRRMGETEPHWSVLTHEKFKKANIPEAADEFFASGVETVEHFRSAAERCGVPLRRRGTCFELGCGVGRSTIWLAEHFEQVIAADVSAPHLALADDALRRYARDNVRLMHMMEVGAIERLPSIDAFFSIIVLQHNPPPLIGHQLRAVLAKLNPGGLAYFQVPTYALGYEFVTEAYLAAEFHPGTVEMHVFPQPELYKLVAEAGCQVLEVREDGATGDWRFISNRFLIQKM